MTATPIVALDVPDLRGALTLVDQLAESCGFYKVGSELFTAEGPGVLESLRSRGKRVFLDLKLHDIPNTVRSASRRAAGHGASLLTVHATGGAEMVRAAVEGAGGECGVLAVTILTSMDAPAVAGAWGRDSVDVSGEVVRLAAIATSAGAHGVVCAGPEVAAVHRSDGRLAILVPGIRFADGAVHDQRRVVSPSEAARAGARYLVLGRAVTEAPDPVAAMGRVQAELASVAAVTAGS